MSCRVTFFLILLSIVIAIPAPQYRDVASQGPEGTLTLERRFADTVGTATQVWMNGPVEKNTVLHTSRTGPLSAVYRSALNVVRKPCQPTDDFKCEVAVNGFGTVGEVQYDFRDAIENVKGRSTQVMVACRCVDAECEKAVLIRPVNIFETLPASGSTAKPKQRTCLYEAVGNSFSDCHTELLRSVRRRTSQRAEYTHGGEAFVYTVNESALRAEWTAQGQRGWTRDCVVSEIDALDSVTMDDINEIQGNYHSTPADNGCKPPNKSVRYLREEDEEDPDAGENCYATYAYASAAASYIGSMQDGIAIGSLQESFVDQKPSLVSNTELALMCSAAGLGVLVAWGIFRKQLKKANTSGLYLGTVLIIQILSYVLEALPLHVGLGQEIDARAWQSEFAFIDGSVALAQDQLGTQGKANGSVLVLTAVLGTVQYYSTRVSLVAGFTVAFDFIAVSILLATLFKKKQFLRKARKTGLMDGGKGGWMNHIVGLHSRALQTRVSLRPKSDARDLQSNVANAKKSDGDISTHLQGKKVAALSTESMSVDITTYDSNSADIAEDVPDAEGAVSDDMRRRLLRQAQTVAPGDTSHSSEDSLSGHLSGYESGGRRRQ